MTRDELLDALVETEAAARRMELARIAPEMVPGMKGFDWRKAGIEARAVYDKSYSDEELQALLVFLTVFRARPAFRRMGAVQTEISEAFTRGMKRVHSSQRSAS